MPRTLPSRTPRRPAPATTSEVAGTCGIELLQPEPRGRVVDVVGPPAPDRSQRRGEPVRQVGATSQHLAPPVVPVLRPGGVAELQRCPREVGEVDDLQDDPPRPRRTRACLRGADNPVQPGRDGVDELDTERLTRPLQRPCVGCVEDLTHHWRQPLGRQHRDVLHGPILGDGGPAGLPPSTAAISTGDRRVAECLSQEMNLSESPLSRRAVIGGGAAAAVALSVAPATSAWARPLRLDYPFTLGVASGDPEPTSVVLWTRLAPAPFTPGHGMRGHDEVTRPVGGGARRGHELRREARQRDDVRRVGALGARRGEGTAAGARVLVPVRGRRTRQPRRTDPDRTRARELGGGSVVRLGVVPGLRLRVLHLLPAHRRGRPRLRAAPRGLRLRVRHERDGREPRDAGAPDRAEGAQQPRAVAGHPRPLQAGSEPAGGAPAAAVRADVGRPRVLQRLRRRLTDPGRTAVRRRRARRRTRRTGSTCRCGRRRASSPARSASTAGCPSAACCSST